jgi:signal transduction histidine kinase
VNKLQKILDLGNKGFYGRKLSSEYNISGSLALLILLSMSLFNSVGLSNLITDSIQLSVASFFIRLFFIFVFTSTFIVSFLSINIGTSKAKFQNNILSILICYILLAISSYYTYALFIKGSNSVTLIGLFKIFEDKDFSYFGFITIFLLQLIVFISLYNFRKNALVFSEKNELLKRTSHLLQVSIDTRIKDQRESFKALYSEKQKSIEEQLRIFSAIHHELGNSLPALKQDIDNLLEFIDSQNQIAPGFRHKIIAEPLPGEDIADVTTIGQLASRMNKKALYAISTILNLGSLIKANPTKYQPQKIKLYEYLLAEISKFKCEKQNVKILINGDENYEITLDPVQFSFLVQNFLANAIRHGEFNDPEKTYFVLFEYEVESNKLILNIINNGSSLESHYSIDRFLEPFNHFGTSGNTGLGGYLIGIVVKNHGGEIAIIDKTKIDSEYKVCFQILIPINH